MQSTSYLVGMYSKVLTLNMMRTQKNLILNHKTHSSSKLYLESRFAVHYLKTRLPLQMLYLISKTFLNYWISQQLALISQSGTLIIFRNRIE